MARRRAAWRTRLEAELTRVAEVLRTQDDIERVIVFGSMGRGKPRFHSDLDLVVIQRTDARLVDRIERLTLLLRPRVPTDLLVYTPEEWTEMCEGGGFARRVLEEGRVLHAVPAP